MLFLSLLQWNRKSANLSAVGMHREEPAKDRLSLTFQRRRVDRNSVVFLPNRIHSKGQQCGQNGQIQSSRKSLLHRIVAVELIEALCGL